MKSHKYIGLVGIIVSVIFLFLEINYQDYFSRFLLVSLFIVTLYLGIFSWQYTLHGNFKNSILPALKIVLVVGGISLIIGLLK